MGSAISGSHGRAESAGLWGPDCGGQCILCGRSAAVAERHPEAAIIKPPTIWQNAGVTRSAWVGWRRCWVDAEHDVDVIGADLDPFD